MKWPKRKTGNGTFITSENFIYSDWRSIAIQRTVYVSVHHRHRRHQQIHSEIENRRRIAKEKSHTKCDAFVRPLNLSECLWVNGTDGYASLKLNFRVKNHSLNCRRRRWHWW